MKGILRADGLTRTRISEILEDYPEVSWGEDYSAPCYAPRQR